MLRAGQVRFRDRDGFFFLKTGAVALFTPASLVGAHREGRNCCVIPKPLNKSLARAVW